MDKRRDSRDQPKKRQEYVQEEEDAEPQRECHMCGSIPDSIICLNCGHNVDIPCAVQILLESQDHDQLDFEKIKCSICGEVTVLSEEVQAAILSYNQQEDGEEERYGDDGGNEEQPDPDAGEEEEEPLPEDVEVVLTSSKKRRPTPTGKQKESTSEINNLDVSLHFACLDHPSEEYSYYSASQKRLYCAQCLLSDGLVERIRDMKSLRRSIPYDSLTKGHPAAPGRTHRGHAGLSQPHAEPHERRRDPR